VSIPSNLPFYGNASMKGLLINIKVSRNCATQPASFIAIMAHELTHIVLRSLWHKEKENEFYTDLTAMVLGFSRIMQEGRQSMVIGGNTEYKTTYGYLSDEQFNFAFKRIREVLDRYENLKDNLLSNIRTATNELESFRSNVSIFNSLLTLVDNERHHAITPEDMHKIMVFHQPSYIEELAAPLRRTEKRVYEIKILSDQFTRYNRQNLIQIQLHEREIRDLVAEIRSRCNLFEDNIRILKKHTGKRYNIKSRLTRLIPRSLLRFF
jgi:CRISPR/Cas system CMR-associated protein Cmr5 small subunit